MAESKESMQSAIKTLQARTENIEKILEKGNKTVVLQLGSHSIKYGLANDKMYRVRTLIAYKLKQEIESKRPQLTQFREAEFDATLTELQEKLKQQGLIRTEYKQPKAGKPKAKVDIKMKIPERPYNEVDPLFDDHVMWVVENPQYVVHRPIRYGLLNIAEQPLDGVLCDLENIIAGCVMKRLGIKRKDFGNYNVVLVIPDLFPRPHLKELANMFLRNLQFKSMYIHQQSVLASFGTSVSSACVVDIGYEKTTICCVDEGVILPGTVVRKNFGSRHLNDTLYYLLQSRKLLGYNKKNYTLDPTNEADIAQLDKLKEKAVFVKDPEDYSNRIYEVFPIREGKEQPIPIAHSDLLTIPAHSFFTKAWNYLPQPVEKEAFDHRSELFDLYYDREDCFEEFSGGGDIYPALTESPHYNPQMTDPWVYCQLEDMVCYSIANIKDADFRKKMANSILLVGGAAHLTGMVEVLEDRLIERINFYDNTIERVEIVDIITREILPSQASWLGGSVLPKLDSLRDLWIERTRFIGQYPREDNDEQQEAFFDKKFFQRKEKSQQWGMRYLKQKVPFQW